LHARDLAPAVAAMLQVEGWKPSDIQGLIINRGPGSYTGLRVGVMSAKAFAYATGCALIAVDGFAAVARQAPPEALQIAVIADAQQERVYHQTFKRSSFPCSSLPPAAGGRGDGGEGGLGADFELAAVSPLRIDSFSDWLQTVPNESSVSGPGLRTFRARLPTQVSVPPEASWDPHSGTLLDIGLTRYLRGQRDDIWKLQPLYLRPSSAEEKWGIAERGAS
jgi:tRNA threonylcarbamoyladenosine biosynthesis protein TsaB